MSEKTKKPLKTATTRHGGLTTSNSVSKMLSFDTSRRRSTTDGNWQDYVGRTEWCLGPACSRTFWLSAARHHPPATVVCRHKRADYLHSEIELWYRTAQTPIFQPVASVTAQQCVVNKIELPDYPPSRTAVF